MTTNGPLSVVSPDPDVTNDLALDRLRESRGRALPELLPEVDRAAGLDPLDGRPLLFHALQRILAPGPNASPPISMLEASRRQNPRLVETRLLLLDAYGRTGQAGRAMDEAKALMALVPEQHALVVRLIAGLAGRPGGPEALERALPTSPVKGDVMLRLAQTGADRALLQRFAAAMRGVAHDPSARDWVGQLVSTVAQRPDPEAARALWATLYDVDPARYGQAAHSETDAPRANRDAWEIALFDGACALGLPVLGVCRGAQVINVARGGTLVQHLESIDEQALDDIVDTRWNPPVTRGVRLVSVIDDAVSHVGQAQYVRGLADGWSIGY